jgi:type VI secretion system protein ImpG
MPLHEQEDLLRYYWRELTYLRKMGAVFAHRYPKVAARLELGENEVADPHVERLIEAFAFLTGRLQYTLDRDFPEIATELLSLLYPHYLNPIPSMAIARLDGDPDQGDLTSGYDVPAHIPLFIHSEQGLVSRFRTCYPTTLWPLATTHADFLSPDRFDFLDSRPGIAAVLRLRVETTGPPLTEIALDRLRFYLNGDRLLVTSLYEVLFGRVVDVVAVTDTEAAARPLGTDAVQQVGFGRDEIVIPYPPYSQPAYRLLQEYFIFPEKFSFFEIAGLERLRGAGKRSIDLLFLLETPPETQLSISADTFPLGCTPIINLFPKTTEPLRIDHRTSEYRLVPDFRREATTEIHSIEHVTSTSDFTEGTRVYKPFYSFDHVMQEEIQTAFWHARRVPSQRKDLEGTDILLGFIDLDFQPSLPATEVIYAHTLCTNRRLAERVPAGALLQTDEVVPVKSIVSVTRPTPQISPRLGGQTLWRLVSHLSLNHLSLSEGPESLRALREILRLYSMVETPSVEQQILGIHEMRQHKAVRRIGADAWRGFCQGTEVTVTLDEDLYVGTNPFLFGAVLSNFFALYSSTNSFTQLVVHSRQRQGEWKRWQPMVGERIVL